MEECPKCKKWTLFYDPKTENKICCTCDYKEQVEYDSYIKESNVVSFLRYPGHKTEKIAKTIKI